jgi:hypothetical protein
MDIVPAAARIPEHLHNPGASLGAPACIEGRSMECRISTCAYRRDFRSDLPRTEHGSQPKICPGYIGVCHY